MADLISERRPTKVKDTNLPSPSILTYKMNIQDVGVIGTSSQMRMSITDYCYLKLTADIVNNYACCGDQFEETVFVLDGLKLQIISKDNLLFKFKKGESQIYKEDEELTFEIANN